MHRFCLFAACLIVVAGCGQPAPERIYDPQEASGQVDTSLPPSLQEKQAALKQVLDKLAIQRVDPEYLSEHLPNIRFKETNDSFREGTLGLARWDFDGQPKGSDIPVVLYMETENPDNPEKAIKRVYRVSGGGNAFTITRKS